MSTNLKAERLTVPQSLRVQLVAFRSRVWTTKMIEACALAIAGVLFAFLVVYTVDRFVDTPRSIRLGIFLTTVALWFAVPWAFHRWVWRHRRLDQLARLLCVREPNIGDQLLSVIELADSDSEQARSRTLCAAAIEQVATAARGRDLNAAAPRSRLRMWSTAVIAAACIAGLLGILSPSAASNAWSRMSAPWRDTPRYTFTSVLPVASRLVVPHGEASPMSVVLNEHSSWQPESATLQIGDLEPIRVNRTDRAYHFEIPAQTDLASVRLRVGDFTQAITIEPKLRPELVGANAAVRLPDYLQLPDMIERDVRSGTLSVVEGSRATVIATASRDLQAASINDQAVDVQAASFKSSEVEIATDEDSLRMAWKDHDGLAGREPFKLAVKPVEDEPPSITSQELPRQAVVLDSQQINFTALSADDFGIKRVGMKWRGLDDRSAVKPAHGEKLIAAGGPNQSSIQVPATFSAVALGIEPQPIEVRLWTEDFLPGRERVYSPPHIFYVLTAEQHAIWITEQLSKWHRAALDVRDREMQLHETNKQLRAMTPEELADEQMRKDLRAQAAAEASNGRKLSNLSRTGEDLLRQAARNPEIGVGHLDRWAEMLQILGDISANRMPSVSDLLGKASAEAKLARGTPKTSGPMAGQVRASTGGASNNTPDENQVAQAPKLPIPSISDVESTLQPADDKTKPGVQPPSKGGSKLGLPITTISGPAKPNDKLPPEQPEDESKFDLAIEEQQNLLAEFERIADELNTILANLEGSTLVKRLKAASREQSQVAERISSRIDALFGRARQAGGNDKKMLGDLSVVEEKSGKAVSYIMDDMQSYFERRRMNQFKLVLDEMRSSEILGALRQLGEEIPKEQGLSIAQAEYWSDTLDRWADDLVDPASSGVCPGSKNSDMLPPSLILEVLKILEGEVNLREATRVADQAKPAVSSKEHLVESERLSKTQDALRDRIDVVVEKIVALPQGDQRFGKEINLLSAVSGVMSEATDILASMETGSIAIATETEAIELLLQIKRINPKGGGGGGPNPGGGGSGTTQDSALALLGAGFNQNEKRQPRDVTQATGETGRVLPEEFRAGLDEYFNRLENGL